MVLDNYDGPESSQKKVKQENVLQAVRIIPIVGPGGVGKTTLAQVIYNHPRVDEYFSEKFWVYVSDNFDVNRIVIEMLVSNNSTKYINMDGSKRRVQSEEVVPGIGYMNVGTLIDKLIGMLRNERFLFVLDDVCNQIGDNWDRFLAALNSGKPGSTVLVTTQNQRVADRIGTIFPLVLNVLDWDNFWPLFDYCALDNVVMSEEKRSLQSIGWKIAKKLHGLPLAAKVIGNLLRSDLDEKKWRRILESEWWNIPEGLNNILPSLGLSYQQLELGQRQCFAYCSIFPKNYLFEKDRVVQMWIAHDFIQKNGSDLMRLEDKGRQWFDELVKRSFFQPTWSSKWYIMHELMRDLAIAVSWDECSFHTDDSREIRPSIRHLGIETDKPEVVREISNYKNLRTILFFGNCKKARVHSSLDSILSKFRGIRVLDLSYIDMEHRDLPYSFRYLSHLRFLDVSWSMVESLSESIFNNCHLQVLNVNACNFLNFPKSLTKLINLRHLYAPMKLISLIPNIGELTNLQELEEFQVSNQEGHRLRELKNMNEITGKLRISTLQNVSLDEAMESNLKSKKHLISLELSGSIGKDMLEGLQPHENLEELCIEHYLSMEFPNWMVVNFGFTYLRSIHISHCNELNVLPPFGQLPSLKILSLENLVSIEQVGGQFYGNSTVAFPSLEELTIRSMENWERWCTMEGRELFPQLKKLILTNCPVLRETPLLSFKSSLVELKVNFDLYELPRYIEALTSLGHLKISGSSRYVNSCQQDNVKQLPKQCVSLHFGCLKGLENLSLESGSNVKLGLPEGFLTLVNLKSLEVRDCEDLFVEQTNIIQTHEEQGLQSLTHLYTDEFLLKRNNYLMLGRLPSLRVLKIIFSTGESSPQLFEFREFTVEQNAWFQQLTSLQELKISNCRTLESLSPSFGTLDSLKSLTLDNCYRLKSLPAHCVPPRLRQLHLHDCSYQLIQRCKKEPQGADWPNIAHIPYIHIDEKTLQRLHTQQHFASSSNSSTMQPQS